jgi:hypothetical protein
MNILYVEESGGSNWPTVDEYPFVYTTSQVIKNILSFSDVEGVSTIFKCGIVSGICTDTEYKEVINLLTKHCENFVVEYEDEDFFKRLHA